MLRIIQNAHAAGAKSYYSTADYYSEGQELEGRWRGMAATQLGLSGPVAKKDWDSLCDNQNPSNGAPLTLRNKTDRTVGYDFNFHVPKSVSLMYAVTRDDRILEAFRDSVDDTMHDMEAEMATRVRKNGMNENRTTGNMVWGEFIHFTARPVDGVPDPHLHAHCFVFNTTWDEQEKTFKAGQFRGLKRDAPYFEAVFHSRFAHRLSDLGLPIHRTDKNWELAGINASTLKKFSRRTAEIEDLAREKGIENAEVKSELGARTRSRKQKELSFTDLQTEWRERMSTAELEQLELLERKFGSDSEPDDGTAAATGLEYAKLHAFERQSVVPERKLIALALRQSVGKATLEDVLEQSKSLPLIRVDRDGQMVVTTQEVLAEERQIIGFARQGRGQCSPILGNYDSFKCDWLNAEQKSAVRHILGSRDRVTLLRGAAGVGKTTLMQETVEAIQNTGIKVFAFAPSADASRGVLRAAGFDEADTVARLLVDKKLQQEARGQLIWVDEAGLLGAKTMNILFELSERINARVLLSGDRKQHASVERGSTLKLLETEAGIVPAEVKEIKRQSGDYKAAVKFLSEGKTLAGFDKLSSMHWVKELDRRERYQVMAADFVAAVTSGQTALAVSPTHAEGARITAEIRERLQKAKLLGKDSHKFAILTNARFTEAERGDSVNYAPTDVVVFHQNAPGIKRGARLEAKDLSDATLKFADRFQTFHTSHTEFAAGDRIRITHNGTTADGAHRLNNGALYTIKGFTKGGGIQLAENGWTIAREFGHLTHGYVVTSYASQGKSVKQVFIGQSSESFAASSPEQFYVSVSRGENRATIYTDSKLLLRQAIAESEQRLSAIDLVPPYRPGMDLAYRAPQIETKREELANER